MKPALRSFLVLGWIPTLAIVSALWFARDPVVAQGRTPFKVTRMYTGADGTTKAEELEIPLKPGNRGIDVSGPLAVTNLQFRRTNQDYFIDWHRAPRRQLIVTLSGETEVEIDGGRKVLLSPGHLLLVEDLTGKGHVSRAAGSGDRLALDIWLADGAALPR